MDISTHDLEQAVALRRQIDSLEKQLASQRDELRARLREHHKGVFVERAPSARGKRFSAATRAKLAAAARARWARIRAGKGAATKPKKKKGGLTAAGRRRLSQLMKARWAARRRASKG